MGIGFIEISAIAGAIELIIGILFTRAPGMTLMRMPIFAWAMLVTAVMIVFAFPAVIAATTLLKLERAFDWPFFIAARGGDALLWQHLFWFFGHPEVYIIFLPAAGMVSMMVAAQTGTPLVGHRAVVYALIGVGVVGFALWVHHMFAAGWATPRCWWCRPLALRSRPRAGCRSSPGSPRCGAARCDSTRRRCSCWGSISSSCSAA